MLTNVRTRISNTHQFFVPHENRWTVHHFLMNQMPFAPLNILTMAFIIADNITTIYGRSTYLRYKCVLNVLNREKQNGENQKNQTENRTLRDRIIQETDIAHSNRILGWCAAKTGNSPFALSLSKLK